MSAVNNIIIFSRIPYVDHNPEDNKVRFISEVLGKCQRYNWIRFCSSTFSIITKYISRMFLVGWLGTYIQPMSYFLLCKPKYFCYILSLKGSNFVLKQFDISRTLDRHITRGVAPSNTWCNARFLPLRKCW